MRLTPASLFPSIRAGWVVLFTTLSLFPLTPQVWSAPSPPLATALHATPPPQPDADAYNKPIIFFEEDSTILVFYPNGDIIYRGRKLTNDYEVVRALQEILSLSPCRRAK
jgi:hypothetical protein